MIGAMARDNRFTMRGWVWAHRVLLVLLLLLYSPPFNDWCASSDRGRLAFLGMLLALFVLQVGATLALPRRGRGLLATGPMLLVFSMAFPAPDWLQYLAILGPLAFLTIYGPVLDRVEREKAENGRLLRAARDEALRLKLAPHFLFNALNTMKAQIASDPQGAASTADRLAALLRQVLDGSGRLTVPLREELAFVESYLGIERIRFGDRLRVTVNVPERAELAEIPPLSLQVLVENAVKHGIAPREEGGEIRIWARTEPWGTREKVRIGVESPLSEGGQAGPGVGLETLRARLREPGDLVLERGGGLFRARFDWIDDREPAHG